MRRCLPLALLLGCTSGAPSPGPPPAAPTTDDPAYQVTARSWLMAGDGLTPADPYDVTVAAPPGTRFVDLWIDGGAGVRLARAMDGRFHASAPTPAPGEHTALLAADGAAVAFAARPFRVSAALYTIVSTDWDTSDNPDEHLLDMETLRQRHPRLVMSQFFGPYVMTDLSVPEARRKYNVDWIKRQRDQFGDEIGLHVHPRCTFIDTVQYNGAPLPCRSQPSFVDAAGDPSGYSVIVDSYPLAEQSAFLAAAVALFQQNGLGTPTSFRAGGWTTGPTTLAALSDAGFTVDSSAGPPDTIAAVWGAHILGMWMRDHWGRITTTSQPYYPSRADQQADAPPPRWPVLEVPDNGCLVDYMSTQQMKDVLAANWSGAPLPSPRVYQVGLHPTSFHAGFLAQLDGALAEVDLHLYADDAGPVRYVRLTDLTRAWPAP